MVQPFKRGPQGYRQDKNIHFTLFSNSINQKSWFKLTHVLQPGTHLSPQAVVISVETDKY